jgi:propionyl-CoA carboxylase alpha chain
MAGRAVIRERRRAVWLDKTEIALEVTREGDAVAVAFVGEDGRPGAARLLASSWKPGDPVWSGTIDGAPVAVQVRAIPNGFVLALSIAVAVGQEVKAGETLAVVEAMKMENVLRTERDGVVKKIHVKPGDSLAVDAVILEFE